MFGIPFKKKQLFKANTVMKAIAVKGEVRSEVGKKSTKAARVAGLIPCVLYGNDTVVHFTTTQNDVKQLIYTPDFKLADIEVGGKHYRCILKDLQFHATRENVLHIDFLHLADGNSLKVEVPVRFKGTAAGVKAGGKLLQKVRKVKIKTTPEKLVDELLLDITHLELGQSIRVRDIKATDGVEILSSPGIPVATIEIPRALRSAAQAAEKATTGKKK